MWVPNMAGVCASVITTTIIRGERARKRQMEKSKSDFHIERGSKPKANEPFDCLNIVKKETEGE